MGQSANVGIQSIVPAKVSMEDIFLQIVQGVQSEINNLGYRQWR